VVVSPLSCVSCRFYSPSQGVAFFNMTYKVDEFAQCETLCEGTPEMYMVGVTKPSVDKILTTDCAFDALALYTFYCYVAKWQGNNSVYAVADYCMKKLQIGRDRFHKAKQALIDLELVEDDPRYDHENKRMGKWYIRVRHISGATLRKTYYVENQQGRKTDSINQRVINNKPESNSNKPEETKPVVKTKRKPKLVDDAFIAELKRLNPEKEVDKEVQMARTWILAKPERQFTQQFLSGWINRSKNTITPERFSNF